MKLTTGQKIALRCIDHGNEKPGIAPGALGRIVGSLYDRKLVVTNASYIFDKSFANLDGFSLTKAGKEALASTQHRGGDDA